MLSAESFFKFRLRHLGAARKTLLSFSLGRIRINFLKKNTVKIKQVFTLPPRQFALSGA